MKIDLPDDVKLTTVAEMLGRYGMALDAKQNKDGSHQVYRFSDTSYETCATRGCGGRASTIIDKRHLCAGCAIQELSRQAGA